MERNIDDIVSTLKEGKEANHRCSLLIGAGCSVKAGIPLASDFVGYIKEHHSSAYNRAIEKTYPHCMAELPSGTRRDLIGKYVDEAKINWAHIAIAQLIKSGYVDRVLTPNFDPLVMRACALVGEFPAVYDFASSQQFNSAYLPDKAIFHLHGQRAGFSLLHTKEQVNKLSDALSPVFKDAGNGRTWLIVGYSGDNDPVFEHLVKVPEFEYGLYWITYRDNRPAQHVQDKLLRPDKHAFSVSGYDADEFFVELAQKLHCFPPDLISRPFSHLDDLLNMLTPYELPISKKESEEFDFSSKTREQVKAAINLYEEFNPSSDDDNEKQGELNLVIETQKAILAGNLTEAIRNISKMPALHDPEVDRLNSWTYIKSGNQDVDIARLNINSWKEADRLYSLAIEKYQAALAIRPDMHEAFNNWGIALGDQAGTKQGEASDRLYALAFEKYQSAVAIKPDNHEALNNWGYALSHQAKTKQGEAADKLYSLAFEKYQEALSIKPNTHEALFNWGIALGNQAESKEGEEADKLYALAFAKYQATLAIKPDKHEALFYWGNALSHQAKTKQGEEADRLFVLAFEKYQAVLAIKPDNHEALNNWGIALLDQAKTKQGEDADRLYALAFEKFQAALFIKPDKLEALNNWGIALLDQAKTKQDEEAKLLYELATIKFQTAESLQSGSGAYNLACIASIHHDENAAYHWLEVAKEHNTLNTPEHIAKDSDLNNVRDCPWFQNYLVT